MKIISNFKDYYDYLQQNGIDEKVVYDRRTEIKSWNGTFVRQGYVGPQFIKDKEIVNFHICGNLIRLKYLKGKYHLDTQIPADGKFISNKNAPPNNAGIQQPNVMYNCPVVVMHGWETIKNPRLSIFDFGKFLNPELLYQLLYDWCSTSFSPEDNRTDQEKIVGNGFDLKHSFRNTK